MATANPQYNGKNISATANDMTKSSGGTMGGILVSSVSGSPTIAVYDGATSAGTKIVDTFVPVAGTYYPMPFSFQVGLSVVIASTVSCTVFWV